MKIKELSIAGAFLIDLEVFNDNRGSFARVFCSDVLTKHIGTSINIVQINHSTTTAKGTIRGMHFQNAPYMEDKLIRCIAGSIYDVVLDLREESPTFLKWEAVELSKENKRMIYIPKGCAHGFQSLSNNVEMIYHHTAFYNKGSEGGILYNDPSIGIEWPLKPKNISTKDLKYPLIANSTFKALKA